MIKYVIHSKKWRDHINGNTYHAVRILNTQNNLMIATPFQYGYGEQFIQSASEVMLENNWIKEKLKGIDFQEIHIIDQDDCKKKEVLEWGKDV
mgnify:FL=1|tara:strand:+ start:975 stop:1253 length:279 start_codon:yes stop_codon:yes gene_type:complete